MWLICDNFSLKFNNNLNRIDTVVGAILSFRLYEWNGLHDCIRHSEANKWVVSTSFSNNIYNIISIY